MKEEDKEGYAKFASDEFNAMIAELGAEFSKRFPDGYRNEEAMFFYESVLNQMSANLMAKVLCASSPRDMGKAHLELHGKFLDHFLVDEMETMSLCGVVTDIFNDKNGKE